MADDTTRAAPERAAPERRRGEGWINPIRAAIVVVMIGCGFGWGFNHTRHDNQTIFIGSPPTQPTTPGTTGPTPEAASAELKKKLLAVTNFPANWTSEGAESDGGEANHGASVSSGGGPSCLGGLDFLSSGLGEADVTLDYGSTQLPSISEYLYSAPGRSTTVFQRMVQTVSGCGTSSFDADGASFKGQFTPLAVPGLPAGSMAFAGLFITPGATFGEDLVFVRQGDDILSLSDSDTGPPRVTQVGNATRAALAKLAQPTTGAR